MSDSDEDVGPMPAPEGQHADDDSGEDEDKRNEDKADDDVGPQPADGAGEGDEQPRKRRRVLKHEELYLENLPCGLMYEKSYMHRDVITHTCVASTEFLVTASNDGQLKFWKKMDEGIEFVKEYRAHLGPMNDVVVSSDGQFLATASSDKSIKVFHVTTFDMIRMVRLDFEPGKLCWAYDPKHGKPLLAVGDANSADVHLVDTSSSGKDEFPVMRLHTAPVTAMAYNAPKRTVVSIDKDGMVEYWNPLHPSWELPSGTVSFQFKSETSLFTFSKNNLVVHSIAFSPNGSLFATTASDLVVRVFKFATGRVARAYDESLDAAYKLQKNKSDANTYQLEPIDFGRRMAIEKELQKSSFARLANVVFDESGNFIAYATHLGIKLVNLKTNKVCRLLGKVENMERFYALSLYQGRAKTNIYNPVLSQKDDPMVVCAAFKKHRFYLFTRREPVDEGDAAAGRDVFNEKPSKEDLLAAKPVQNPLGQSAVIHTTLGDIHIKLFPDECPRTVENFSTHSKNGYYNNLVFHRIIKGFMVQTGCPLGDGTGGQSIWGGEFEDEIRRDLRHDRPFTVSMANAGPNTNGSQFFITTQPATWLDGKHTVFGRVQQGMDVVSKLERVKTDKFDRPYDPPKIINIDVAE